MTSEAKICKVNLPTETFKPFRININDGYHYGDLLFIVRYKDSIEIGYDLKREMYCAESSLTKFQTLVETPIFTNISCYYDTILHEAQSTHPYICVQISYPI